MTRPLRASTGRPVVIDSSVAFKWFDRDEPDALEAAELLEAHGRDEIALIAPAHLALEVVNALLWRGADATTLREAIGFLADTDLLVAPIDEALLADAASIACDEKIALYDATFIALAARLDAELVTADRKQGGATACRTRLLG